MQNRRSRCGAAETRSWEKTYSTVWPSSCKTSPVQYITRDMPPWRLSGTSAMRRIRSVRWCAPRGLVTTDGRLGKTAEGSSIAVAFFAHDQGMVSEPAHQRARVVQPGQLDRGPARPGQVVAGAVDGRHAQPGTRDQANGPR